MTDGRQTDYGGLRQLEAFHVKGSTVLTYTRQRRMMRHCPPLKSSTHLNSRSTKWPRVANQSFLTAEEGAGDSPPMNHEAQEAASASQIRGHYLESILFIFWDFSNVFE